MPLPDALRYFYNTRLCIIMTSYVLFRLLSIIYILIQDKRDLLQKIQAWFFTQLVGKISDTEGDIALIFSDVNGVIVLYLIHEEEYCDDIDINIKCCHNIQHQRWNSYMHDNKSSTREWRAHHRSHVYTMLYSIYTGEGNY